MKTVFFIVLLLLISSIVLISKDSSRRPASIEESNCRAILESFVSELPSQSSAKQTINQFRRGKLEQYPSDSILDLINPGNNAKHRIQLEGELGGGSTAIVYLGRDLDTDAYLVARVKRFSGMRLDYVDKNRFFSEMGYRVPEVHYVSGDVTVTEYIEGITVQELMDLDADNVLFSQLSKSKDDLIDEYRHFEQEARDLFLSRYPEWSTKHFVEFRYLRADVIPANVLLTHEGEFVLIDY